MRIALSGVSKQTKELLATEILRRWPDQCPPLLDTFAPKIRDYLKYRTLNEYSLKLYHHTQPNFLTVFPLYDCCVIVSGFSYDDTAGEYFRILRAIQYDRVFYIPYGNGEISMSPSPFFAELDHELKLMLDFFRVPYNVLIGAVEQMVDQIGFVLGWARPILIEEKSDV